MAHPVTAARAAEALDAQKRRGYDPAGAPLGRILDHNHVHRHIPGTGGRLSHEYGNAECSAAMARYANPRARGMYEFVRKTMADKKGRIRGIEYTR